MAFTPSDPAVISIRFTPERLRLLEGLQQADQRDFEALHQELENTVQERNTLRSDNAALRAEISSLKAENNRLAAENGNLKSLSKDISEALRQIEVRISHPLSAGSSSQTPPHGQTTVAESNLTRNIIAVPSLQTLPPVEVKREIPSSSVKLPATPSSFDAKKENEDDGMPESHLVQDPSYLTETPRGRLNELKRFPELVDVPAFDNLPIYSRDYLSTQLGGSIQPLIVPIGKQKQLSASLQIKKFLVPNQSMNPWCPRAPGQHGFMFVGLGAESHTFEQEECLPLFVSKPRSGGNLEASYFGDYHVSRVEPLTLEEWNTLAPAVQKSYAQCTARKEKRDYDWISTLHAYNAGLKRVPCVRLVCVAFRYELFQGLSAPTLTLKRKRSVGDLSDGE